MHRTSLRIFITFSAIIGALTAFAELPPHNIASGSTYECAPPPDYWGWKNPGHGDHGQLTDGTVNETWDDNGKPFYSQSNSMGWNRRPPVVIFDLGERHTITGIGMHSSLSFWGPWWPASIAVLVSNDNKNFYLAGPEIVPTPDQLDPPLTGETVQVAIDRVMAEKGLGPTMHWFRRHGLNATGRYLALFMTKPPDTGVIVIDEIEVYGHNEPAPAVVRPTQVFKDGPGGTESYTFYRAINQRLSLDIATLRAKFSTASIDEGTRNDLMSRFDTLDARRASLPIPPTEGFKAVLPINPLHEEIFALHAALWRAEGAPRLRLWKTHRLDPLTPLHQPAGAAPKLEITMGQNSVRADVLNISCSGQDPASVELELRGLPTEHIEVCEVPLVDTHAFEPVAAPIIPARFAGGRYQVAVSPGMTRQVWLRCSTGGLAANRYEGTIHLTSDNWSADVPVSIEVLPVKLPDRFSIHIGGWEYPWAGTYQITEQNLDQFLSVLKEYGVNTTWAANPFPQGTYDEEGSLVQTPSRRMVDEWLERWPHASLYCPVLFEILPMDEPLRAQKYAAWAKDWSAYLRTKGIAPERVAMLVRDEPTSEQELQIILDTGRAIKKGEPRFKIWNDIHYPNPLDAPPILSDVMRDACDIQCFNTQHFLASPDETLAFKKQESREGLQWWTYTGAGAHRLADPYVAWQLRFWLCFDTGLTGAHFWAFGDGGGGFSWNEYFNTSTTRSPLYLDAEQITIGKSLEAMREGAQDYELLKMLEKKSGEEAVRKLRDDVKRVLLAHTDEDWLWKAPKDRSVADAVRIKVLRKLADLQSGG